jgi:hypothetical protein
MNNYLPSWNEFTTNLSNFGIGMTEAPSELAKVGLDLATWGAGKLDNIPRKQLEEAYKQNEILSNKLKPMQYIAPEYDNWLNNQANANSMRVLGNIGGGAVSGGLLAKEVINSISLLKNPSILKQMQMWGRKHPVELGALLGTAKSLQGEAITEPYVESLTHGK